MKHATILLLSLIENKGIGYTDTHNGVTVYYRLSFDGEYTLKETSFEFDKALELTHKISQDELTETLDRLVVKHITRKKPIKSLDRVIIDDLLSKIRDKYDE